MITPISNAAQIDYWNGEVGRRWAALQDRLDGLFVEITALAIEAAAPQPGERVIDVGCGCGATVLDLAAAVGPQGRVMGLDISEVMLGVARTRIAAKGLAQAEVSLADAATRRFEASADLVFSRFGVMFFDAPAAAFAHIRTALKPDGRIAFVCWRALDQNGWVTVPMRAAGPWIDMADEAQADPDAPGPFAFADPTRLRRILGEAGFSQIGITPVDAMLRLAPTGEVEAAADIVTQIGPVSRALKTLDDAPRDAARRAVAAALRAHDGPEFVSLPAAVWIVTALK